MPTTEQFIATRLKAGPKILCPQLPAFDASDLAAIQRAFQRVKPCQLLQAWRSEVSPGFAPASVRVGWRDDCLLLLAELSDNDVFSNVSAINQRAWELGDAFEIFLRPAGQITYVQLDIVPNNHRMQLRITSAEALWRAQTTNEFAALTFSGEAFYSGTWIVPEQQKWFAYAAIPARTVCGRAELPIDGHWHFSFGRYDYTRGEFEPVISSTSPHAEPNFHRQQEWGMIHFTRTLVR